MMNIRNEILRVNSCYEAFITQKQSKREEFYSAFKEGPIWNNSLISEHMEETQHIPTEPFQTEKKIFMIIRDLLIFPELYLDDIDQNKLSDLFHLIDNHDCFNVFFLSSGRHIMKPHGSIGIGCSTLKQGMSISGAGDPTRIKMRLPTTFKQQLIQFIESKDSTFSEKIREKFGSKKHVIKTLTNNTFFDSFALNELLDGIENSDVAIKRKIIVALNKVIFKYKFFTSGQTYAAHQELWTKPRSVQQHTDTKRFNVAYLNHFEDLKKPSLLRQINHLHHPITRRTALRKQNHVKTSTPLKNFLAFERNKNERDKKRTLVYRFKTEDIWTYGGSISHIFNSGLKTSECTGAATRLLGAKPHVASLANHISRTGLTIQLKDEEELQKKKIQDFFKMPHSSLKFGHANTKGKLRNDMHRNMQGYSKGAGIIYDNTIIKHFAIGLGKTKPHVWGCVMTDENGILLNKNQWKPGWIALEKMTETQLSPQNIFDLIDNTPKINDLRLSHVEYMTPKNLYEEKKYCVPLRPKLDSKAFKDLAFQNNQTFMLGSHLAEVKEDKIYWNNYIFNATDYKGKPILIPDNTMYDWLEQRRILKVQVDKYHHKIKETVVFGTQTDKYPLYPDLLGFMPRRKIKQEAGWLVKNTKYASRQKKLNPDRERLLGQQTIFNPPGYHQNFLQNRIDDINEKCGLQVKHAPKKLMINRFINSHDNFILSYLQGSQGIPTEQSNEKNNSVHRPRPKHITDHELYRAFSGKHRDKILNNMRFADENLVFDAPSKVSQKCYNPIRLFYHRKVGLRHTDVFVSPFRLD